MIRLGRMSIPNKDKAREEASSKPGPVTVRQMTPEERERMERIKPVTNSYGQKRTAPVGMWFR